MSMYGEDGETGYAKEELYYAIKDFLKEHSISELFSIISDATDRYEEEHK